ncbi:carbohydrate ABC transporter permease [Anaerocolumna xylanovorans]|uniref:Multiple sugar transport system permease protein n=1 Tax=Anaerocolumna xylanovorans DSM 12503 TaxID=1121345 RepID=A0A1M7Y8C9_9FIRM|nr:carbohydrate ABC transporter permease [Anaerocolumna xylanovorans]SHO48895.1 multiple sugar transport system permease protein [Anaerocolumna xylanovorans DSM 12503]
MRTKKTFGDISWYAGACLIALVTVYPLLWMVATSLKPEKEIFSNSLSLLSKNFSMNNYKDVFDTIPFLRYFINSMVLAVSGVVTNVFLGALAGYSYAKLKFSGRKLSFAILLSSMMIPGIVTMIPQFLVLKYFPLVGGNNIFGQGGRGFINNYAAIILPGAVGAFAVFFMKQFFETLPDDLAEAARVDGCSEFKIFWKIYLPLIKPAAMTLGIMTFQSGWNAFMWPMIVLNSKEMMTIQVGLSTFQYQYNTSYGPLMAGTVIATLPTLLLFVFAQKYYIQGIAFTGSK